MNIDQEGETVYTDGKVVGKHKGYMHYTIGKRRGFTVDGAHDPHFVLSINTEKNQIVVGKKEELKVSKVVLKDLNMFLNTKDFEASIKVRYKMPKASCHTVIKNNKAIVDIYQGVYGVAKGQAGVFYKDGKILGGGWII